MAGKQTDSIVAPTPKSIAIAERGIGTTQDFLNLMAAIATDVLSARITPQMANSVTNAGGKMLKAAEMQMKYGIAHDGTRKILQLAEAS